MKVAVLVLLVAVGACSAAFSGSLIEKTRPLINQAGLRASIATSSLIGNTKAPGDLSALIQGVIAHVVEQAHGIIAQINENGGGLGGLSLLVKAKIRAAIVALRVVLHQIGQHAVGEALEAYNTIAGHIAAFEALLNGGGSGVVSRGFLSDLLGQLNLGHLLEQALGALCDSDFIQGLVQQLLPYLDQAGSLCDQVVAIILGQSELSRAAPRGIFELIARIRAIFAAILASAGSSVEAAHAAALELLQGLIADGQTDLNGALQQLIQTIEQIRPFLGPLAQPVIDALQALLSGN